MNKAMLVILDGWGHAPVATDNAISVGDTPVWNKLLKTCPHTLLNTSGSAVGLPAGQMGNSEVGHMNIGAGRVVYQSLTRIGKALEDHGFHDNTALCDACDISAEQALHILGLLSPGGVHSHEDHLAAMVALAKSKGVKHIYLHAFLDGRDTPPQSAMPSLKRFMAMQDEHFRLASVIGRYYAMDRDNNWDRIAKAYHLIVDNSAEFRASDALAALNLAYARGESDEFVQATALNGAVPVKSGDSLVFMNFRADRARQLASVFCRTDFAEFAHRRVCLSHLSTLTQYQSDLKTAIAFLPQTLLNGLGETVAAAGLKQLRIAETEKYAHVTYFFNGGEETVFPGEDRILVKSPAVATYDLQPQMAAPQVTAKLIAALRSEQYDFICVNFANPDMVGHSGIMAAAVKAVETVDECLGKVLEAAIATGVKVLVTADHGNVEQMVDGTTGAPMTAHTTNPVDLVLVGDDSELQSGGALCDLAPSILALMGLSQPAEMTGRSLIG